MPITGFANKPDDVPDLIKMVGGAPLVIKLLEGTQGIGVVLAALGVTIGLGYGQSAVIMTGVMIAVLLGVDKLENSLRFLRKGVHAHWSDRRQRKQMKCNRPRQNNEDQSTYTFSKE